MTAAQQVQLNAQVQGIECQAQQELPAKADPKNFVPLVLHLPGGQVVQMWLGPCRKIQVLVEPKGERASN